MKIRLEFLNGATETYTLEEILDIKLTNGISHPNGAVGESFFDENRDKELLEPYLDSAIMFGGVIEIAPSPKRALLKTRKINARAIKEYSLIEEE